MGKRNIDIKKLQRLLERCVDSEVKLKFFLPHSDLRNPTWRELTDFATEAYVLALNDVLQAMDGDASSLKKATSEGRIFYRGDDEDFFLERLKELGKNPPSDFDLED